MNTIISISPTDFHSYSFVEGNLNLEGKSSCFLNKIPVFKFSLFEGWHPVCDKNGPLPNEFKIAFNVPTTNMTQVEVCASITGPEELLPKFLQPNCNLSLIHGNKVYNDLAFKM